MKKCTGNGLHPGDIIKFDGDWCPMCRLALVNQNQNRELHVLRKCLKYNQVVKPSRRLTDSTADYEYAYFKPLTNLV